MRNHCRPFYGVAIPFEQEITQKSHKFPKEQTKTCIHNTEAQPTCCCTTNNCVARTQSSTLSFQPPKKLSTFENRTPGCSKASWYPQHSILFSSNKNLSCFRLLEEERFDSQWNKTFSLSEKRKEKKWNLILKCSPRSFGKGKSYENKEKIRKVVVIKFQFARLSGASLVALQQDGVIIKKYIIGRRIVSMSVWVLLFFDKLKKSKSLVVFYEDFPCCYAVTVLCFL